MGRKRNNGLIEEKRSIIGQLFETYDIKTAADIQEALKDILGGTIQSMLEMELEEQVAYSLITLINNVRDDRDNCDDLKYIPSLSLSSWPLPCCERSEPSAC